MVMDLAAKVAVLVPKPGTQIHPSKYNPLAQ